MSEPILDGIRIIDLSWGLAGPVATQILAEAGADVIKVERPSGDPIRAMHPAAFATWNRSKRSVVLDLTDEADRASLDALLASADVLVHGFTPARAARFGLDDATLTSRFPRLVVCGITGYPANHADAERPGWDLLVQARGGLMDYQAGWGTGPFAWRLPVPSWFAGLLAATGIVARLYHRQRAGTGGTAHTSLLQGLHLAQNMVWARAEDPPPSMQGGPSPALQMPQVAMYQCADEQWIQILNPADRVDLSQLPLTIAAIEELGLADVPFDAGIFAAAILQRPSDAWLEAIRAVDVAVELIAPLGTLLDHDETRANGFVVEVDDPVFGRTVQAGPPFRTDPPLAVRSAAPELGQHNTELGELAERPATTPASSGGNGVAAPARPLDGVRVLDVGAFLAGPLAPMLLADLGAEVIKIEPVTGDPLRGWRDEFYIACNRGKRDIALDITSAEGREVLERLVARSDVVHHNMRVKASARLGLDEAGVRAVRPDAVFSHSTAYGRDGQRADWPGYDSVFQAMSGWNVELAGEGNPPLFNHLGNLDMMNGTLSALATLLALYHRQRTGEANATHAALLSTATLASSETLLVVDTGAVAPYPRLDGSQVGIGDGYRIHQASDGWIAVVALDDERRAALRAVAGVDTDDALAEALAGRAAAELVDALDQRRVPAEVVREQRWRTVWDDEEDLRTRLVVSYPQADWGEMRQFGAYWDFGDLELQLDRACPSIGQHSGEILAELGFEADEVARLARSGAVKGPELAPSR